VCTHMLTRALNQPCLGACVGVIGQLGSVGFLHRFGSWAQTEATRLAGKDSFFFFLVFRDRVSLCSPGCPGTHFVDQAGLELRNPPASASRVPSVVAHAFNPKHSFPCV
jgi:hypothetical protein